MMEAIKNLSRVFQGAFKPRNTMTPKPGATPIAHDRNRIETPRPARDQSGESQRPSAGDGDQYSTGVFALISTGGRRSLDSSTERDSPTATRKSSQPAVHEFRNIHQKNGFSGKGRPRRQPGQSQQSSHAPKSSPKLPSTHARNHRRVEDIEDEEEDVLLLTEQLPKPKPRHGAIRNSEPVDLTGEDPAPRQELTITIPAIPADRLGRKRAKADSPDELNDDDLYIPGRANKRSKGMSGTISRAGKSSSLSSKGDIGSTFAPRRGTGPTTSGSDLPRFRLKAAVCPPRSICDDAQVLVPRQSDPQVLDPTQSGGRDATINNGAQHVLPYEWLQVRLATMNRLFYSPGHQHITIERPSFKDFGGKLFLKFLDQEDGRNFVAWAEQQMGDKAKLVIQEAPNTEKQFDNARGHVENFARSQAEKRAETRRSKEQTTHNSKADRLGPNANDVILMALNRRRERAKTGVLHGGPEPTQPRSAKKTLRESMADDAVAISGPEAAQPSTKKRLRESMADNAVAIGGDADVREVKRPNIERRSTRSAPASSAAIAVDSTRVESSPPRRAWTLEHPGWDREWRLPLTYHRTTIHKEDVARLDDGEFLNDSIISFYLNYLHNRLKATDKEAAARFYFHNSFFYERLKPAKGKSINYDNVKSWTSRVDIFKYDFIVVPVNEHSHWWVAVICNPGKLVPDEPASTPEVCATNSVADEPAAGARDDSEDAERSSKGRLSEVPKKSSKDCSIPSSPAMSPRTTSVWEKMRSMSLSQKDAATPAKQAPILIDDEPDNQVIIPDDEAPDPPLVVSDIPSLNNPKVNELARAKESSQTREPPQAQLPALLTGKEPRVITLDSLGSAHSPACTHLKQYLCEELLDKKQQQVKMPSTFGLTAKAIPLQSNHWDCGAYLLSYIDFLMKDPDASIKAILEKRSPGWHVDASKTRSEIRDVIIREHAAYQKEEEAAARAKQEQKRLRKGRAAASSVTGSSPARPTSEAVPLPSRPPDVVAPSLKAAASPEDIVRPSIEHSNVSFPEVLATN